MSPDSRMARLKMTQEVVQRVWTSGAEMRAPCLRTGVAHSNSHMERIPVANKLFGRGEVRPKPFNTYTARVVAGERPLCFTFGALTNIVVVVL